MAPDIMARSVAKEAEVSGAVEKSVVQQTIDGILGSDALAAEGIALSSRRSGYQVKGYLPLTDPDRKSQGVMLGGIPESRSFIAMTKSVGERIPPWGVPARTALATEMLVPHLTR
ncbi:hypothetical protein Bbelb_304240 [Branchiostoma belcheri]|nr:hypothetical protein Bbelb_304240 [Branchiostoma belcheri]